MPPVRFKPAIPSKQAGRRPMP